MSELSPSVLAPRAKKPVCGRLLSLYHVAPSRPVQRPETWTGYTQTPCLLPKGHAGPHEWEDAWL